MQCVPGWPVGGTVLHVHTRATAVFLLQCGISAARVRAATYTRSQKKLIHTRTYVHTTRTSLARNAGKHVCCDNPGGKFHHGPDPGEEYPYYGLPCEQQSDCSQCTVDGTCVCSPILPAPPSGAQMCCQPKSAVPPPSPPTSNHTGFATVALSREGYAGREHDTGAQLLRTSAPEAVVTLDGVVYVVTSAPPAPVTRVVVNVWLLTSRVPVLESPLLCPLCTSCCSAGQQPP
jgi:hypothetical protein